MGAPAGLGAARDLHRLPGRRGAGILRARHVRRQGAGGGGHDPVGGLGPGHAGVRGAERPPSRVGAQHVRRDAGHPDLERLARARRRHRPGAAAQDRAVARRPLFRAPAGRLPARVQPDALHAGGRRERGRLRALDVPAADPGGRPQHQVYRPRLRAVAVAGLRRARAPRARDGQDAERAADALVRHCGGPSTCARATSRSPTTW